MRSWPHALTRLGQARLGVCALIFGGAHFVYMNLTAPLVPKWLPPTPEFWAYATGVAHIAAGIAILTGVQARLAAILLTAMYASFTPLVHIRMLLADPNPTIWIWNGERRESRPGNRRCLGSWRTTRWRGRGAEGLRGFCHDG